MRQLIVTAGIALATFGVLASSIRSADAGAKSADRNRRLVVTSVTPTRNQKMLPDLSDPGANNQITVRFSTSVEPGDLLDEQNLVNGLSYRVEIVNQARQRVAGTPSVRRNVFTFSPLTVTQPVLPIGRYTLTLKSTIHSTAGRRLNDGRSDYSTTFTVGTDRDPPVLLAATPLPGQTGVALRKAVVVTFDEPIGRESLAESVRLEDRSTNPPTRIRARVRLARRGYDVVVKPDPRFAYPDSADVALVIQGRGTSTDDSTPVLTDEAGNGFARDAGFQWTADASVPTLFHSPSGDYDDVSGEFTLTFRTRDGTPSVR
jgi:hypothetical protein